MRTHQDIRSVDRIIFFIFFIYFDFVNVDNVNVFLITRTKGAYT